METMVTIILSIFASSGFWAFVTFALQRKDEKRDSRDKILMGIARRQILLDAEIHFARGYITPDDYNELNDYLYQPYKALGGNGSAERVMSQVKQLPHKEV